MRLLLALLLLALACAGCGATDDLGDELRAERDRFEAELREQEEKLRTRVDEVRAQIEKVLGDLEQAVPRAEETSPEVQARGRDDVESVEGFLTDIITMSIATGRGRWPRTASPSRASPTRGSLSAAASPPAAASSADDNAAFYCSADDTIYIALRFAAALQARCGACRGGGGRTRGRRLRRRLRRRARVRAQRPDTSSGLFTLGPRQLEQAVRAAGRLHGRRLGHSAFAAGRFTEEDIEEAVSTALAVGDFDVSSEQPPRHAAGAARRVARRLPVAATLRLQPLRPV